MRLEFIPEKFCIDFIRTDSSKQLSSLTQYPEFLSQREKMTNV
jgi:hypothetical protein